MSKRDFHYNQGGNIWSLTHIVIWLSFNLQQSAENRIWRSQDTTMGFLNNSCLFVNLCKMFEWLWGQSPPIVPCSRHPPLASRLIHFPLCGGGTTVCGNCLIASRVADVEGRYFLKTNPPRGPNFEYLITSGRLSLFGPCSTTHLTYPELIRWTLVFPVRMA